MSNYDCTNDVKQHIRFVKRYIDKIALKLVYRSVEHDASKLQEPEKSMFDKWRPVLDTVEFGGEEYKAALAGMGEGLKHHYESNRHHPEHFENGVAGMTLIDVVEMVSDWKAAAFMKGEEVNMDYLIKRFGLSEQLVDIIENTLKWFDEE